MKKMVFGVFALLLAGWCKANAQCQVLILITDDAFVDKIDYIAKVKDRSLNICWGLDPLQSTDGNHFKVAFPPAGVPAQFVSPCKDKTIGTITDTSAAVCTVPKGAPTGGTSGGKSGRFKEFKYTVTVTDAAGTTVVATDDPRVIVDPADGMGGLLGWAGTNAVSWIGPNAVLIVNPNNALRKVLESFQKSLATPQ